MSFWDTSAIVPLCRNEDRSPLVRHYWRRFPDRNVWRETIVEVTSTLARLKREGILSDPSLSAAERRLSFIENEWVLVSPTDRQIELARTFPSLYGLKAMDSLQLAAALVWCKEYPKNKDFVSADDRLLSAAESVGFICHDLN